MMVHYKNILQRLLLIISILTKIKYLFCTSTIIEGVNTSAKNIIYYDSTKGRRTPIDFFDYSNIKGRAGRLMVHYIGKTI